MTTNMRNFEFDPVKALEALVYVAQRTPQHDMYKALKALYVADKLHLARYGRLIYGETYSALPYGPVPEHAYAAVKSVQDGRTCVFPRDVLVGAVQRFGDYQLRPCREPDLLELSKSDVECLDEAIRDLAYDSFSTVKNKTHDAAYKATAHTCAISLDDLIEALPEDRREPVRTYLRS